MNLFNATITSFYHPTKIIFLDDNQAFLDAMALGFHEQDNIFMFTTPEGAMEFIKNSNTKEPQLTTMEEENSNLDLSTNSVTTTSNMINMLYDPTRFDHVAVLIVDYSMPSLNGVEFCKQFGDKSIFKILVTAEADKDIAINAFNEGIIDKFILKTHPNLLEQLKTYINELRNKFFINFSKNTFDNYSESLKVLLKSKTYKDLFERVAKQNHAVEYYLVDRVGSVLFLTKEGNPIWLLMSDQKKIKSQVDLLRDYGFPDELIIGIENKETLLFLFSENEYKEEITNWKKYIFKSKKLNDDYSFSIVKGNLTKSIDWDKVASYIK
ncbi:response regulator (plasmid) [Legionella lytica]|uniref:Response regulator n=1 Tax=Legionella lytica TaxID=96232 RepID=A0ABY4YDQ8_9GAMM|nr:response regulator [Legionella lytica]USQ15557.1 response regulator [Legionella lytica]